MKLSDILKIALASKPNQIHRTVAGTKRARQMMSNQNSRTGGIVTKESIKKLKEIGK